jgi:excisionase family DNA binding protein
MNETHPSTVKRDFGTIRRLLRTREAALYLGSSPWKVRRLVQEGVLPRVSDANSGRWLFDLKDLDVYIESNKHYGSE